MNEMNHAAHLNGHKLMFCWILDPIYATVQSHSLSYICTHIYELLSHSSFQFPCFTLPHSSITPVPTGL